MAATPRVAVVGGGWAGLSAAVHATLAGHRVTLFETSRHWGGRARTLPDGQTDNGQHILIGAYHETLELMRVVGVDIDRALLRMPLVLARADGAELRLRPGPALPAFAAAVFRCRAWTLGERLSLVRASLGWALRGFQCQPDCSVAEWAAGLPAPVRQLLIDPLCVAALNTPAHTASAQVFLNVLRDGLFAGPGSSDLLLPRLPLAELLPQPAARWLAGRGAELRLGRRVLMLTPSGPGWSIDGEAFDAVVLACPALEAARLVRGTAPDWAGLAEALTFEPIVTVLMRRNDGRALPAPLMALTDGDSEPAQFVFDHQALRGHAGALAFVISGASPWVECGQPRIAEAVLAQAARQLRAVGVCPPLQLDSVIVERRATFVCSPGLQRPPGAIAPALAAAGDYVAGPYPATLEGAVRAGRLAIDQLGSDRPFLCGSTM